jgi:uncharacterized protein
MFVPFLYHLRAHGLTVTTTEWMALMQALSLGHARSSVDGLYHLGRALLVHRESDFDRYDLAFASFFDGVDAAFDLVDEVLEWLRNPVTPASLTEEQRAALEAWDLERLRKEFEERLREQNERHDGGSHWVGTGGTSPFGSGGTHPTGVRVGRGGGRSAMQVAQERRYQNLRNDVVLDTRQVGAALRRLRRLARDGQRLELDVDATIDKTAREAGEIDLVFAPPRQNRVKLLLLMDVGGSMDPHAHVSERLFSAAHAHAHFKAFKHYYFHNCIYDDLYTDFENLRATPTAEVLAGLDASWCVVVVGDAYMHPMELQQVGGIIDYRAHNHQTGLWWLRQLRERCPRSVWMNPEPPRIWGAPSIHIIRTVFPMFPMTLDGLTEAVDVLRGAKRAEPLSPLR